jgi:hypothetical protein
MIALVAVTSFCSVASVQSALLKHTSYLPVKGNLCQQLRSLLPRAVVANVYVTYGDAARLGTNFVAKHSPYSSADNDCSYYPRYAAKGTDPSLEIKRVPYPAGASAIWVKFAHAVLIQSKPVRVYFFTPDYGVNIVDGGLCWSIVAGAYDPNTALNVARVILRNAR